MPRLLAAGCAAAVSLKKVKDKKREFKTITSQLPSNFWEMYDLEEFRYYQFYKYRNSEFFFARYIIVVESKTDAEVVKKQLDDIGLDVNKAGINFINLEGVPNLRYAYSLLKTLDIPYLMIVDKDFFIPYLRDKLDDSRDSNGFPKYRYEYKEKSFIEKLIPNKSDRDAVLQLLKNNHSKAMDILEKYNIICFKYSLEIDLISSEIARREYFRVLGIPLEEQNKETLLKKRKDQIKKINFILDVVENIPTRNLPNSYKRIRKHIKKVFKSYNFNKK